MQVQTIYLDISPAYIPFTVQANDATGAKTNPTVDSLIIYEEDGTDATEIVAADEIGNSPFDPIQLPTDAGKTGLWGVMIDKTNFTVGKFYICVWELTVDGVTTAAVEIYFIANAAQMKATVTNLDVAVSSRSTLTAAQVWAAAGRALSAPNDYKADVSALAIEANVPANAATGAAVALAAYDPPTRAEATSDKVEVIAEVDANEAKIDIITTMLQYLNGKAVYNIATVAVPARNVLVGMLDTIDMSISATQVLHIELTYNADRNVVSKTFTVV